MNMHPADVLLFNEVSAAMRRVAATYNLPLRNIIPANSTDPRSRDTALGWCSASGDVQILMRTCMDGVWNAQPLPADDVWETAAHELAHLRHMNHGIHFQIFEQEMLEAMRNQKEDPRDKVLRKLVKLQKQRDSEAAIGNSTAAESFAAAINRMLIEHELHPSDLDYARTTDNDPVIELMVDMSKYRLAHKRTRIAWQESLARIVSRAHLCTFLLRSGTNQIWFVGTKAHATVAEYVYATLVPQVEEMSKRETHDFWLQAVRNGQPGNVVNGFRAAWINAFVKRIAERFDEARKSAVKEMAADLPGSESQSLMRLEGAMTRVDQYIKEKFARRSRRASALYGKRSGHSQGKAWGREAANRIAIGRKGIGGSSTRGAIGGK